MTTLAQLKSDTAAWLHKTSLTDVIPSFVRLAEARIRNDVRVPRMQSETELSLSAQSVAMPPNCLEPIRVYLDVPHQRALQYKPPNAFYTSGEFELSGNPTTYTVEGQNIIFAPAPTGTPTAKLLYWAAWDALFADEDTNWLLTNHYNIYLYAVLAEGAAYLEDDEQAAKWGSQYAGVAQQLARRQKTAQFMVPLHGSAGGP